MLFAAVSDESEGDAVARAVLAELAEEILDGVDRLVVEADDDIRRYILFPSVMRSQSFAACVIR